MRDSVQIHRVLYKQATFYIINLILTHPLSLVEETADWEKELQQELQEYEVVTESEKRDENWDKEIEEMLQEEN